MRKSFILILLAFIAFVIAGVYYYFSARNTNNKILSSVNVDELLVPKPDGTDEILTSFPAYPVYGKVYFYNDPRKQGVLQSYIKGIILDKTSEYLIIGEAEKTKVFYNDNTQFYQLDPNEPDRSKSRTPISKYLDIKTGDTVTAIGIKHVDGGYASGMITKILDLR